MTMTVALTMSVSVVDIHRFERRPNGFGRSARVILIARNRRGVFIAHPAPQLREARRVAFRRRQYHRATLARSRSEHGRPGRAALDIREPRNSTRSRDRRGRTGHCHALVPTGGLRILSIILTSRPRRASRIGGPGLLSRETRRGSPSPTLTNRRTGIQQENRSQHTQDSKQFSHRETKAFAIPRVQESFHFDLSMYAHVLKKSGGQILAPITSCASQFKRESESVSGHSLSDLCRVSS